MPGADPIATILDRLATFERAIAPPSGFDTPYVAESLSSVGTFPALLNIPRRMTRTVSTASTRTFRIEIDILLLFAANAYDYASDAQRAWVPVILNAFDTEVTMSQVWQFGEITEVNFDPVIVDDVPYVAITFTLTATVSESFTFEA